LGSIDKNGNYVAPHTAGANQTVSVTATSVSLPAQSGKAMVVLMPSPAGAGSVKPASAGTGSTAPSAPTAALPAPVVQPATPPAAAPSQSLKVSANKPELSDGQDATLTAHLGDSPVDVKWSISPPGVGILSPEGRYFAPQKIDSASEVTITAKKTDNPSISGQIVIKLKANLPKTSDATQ
jgi:hypothetical protein